MENENEIDGKVPPVEDPLFEKIKNFFLSEYHPISEPKPTTLFYSTQEIYNSLQALYPSVNYTMSDVSNWLHERGFAFTATGEMRMEWMLEKWSK